MDPGPTRTGRLTGGARIRRSGRTAAGLGVAALLLGLAAGAGAAGVERELNYSAVASAQGARMTYEVPNYLVVSTFVDGGGPVAQATLASTGAAQSFASLPYPGDTAIAVPGLVAGFGGPELPAGYPFYVKAEHPTTPEQSLDDPTGQGGYRLRATAAERRSAAEAADRLGGAQAWIQRSSSTASVEQAADGSVVSVAESVTEGITIADQLRIGSVRSRSVARLAPGAEQPTVERSLSITGASVGGVNVEITNDGVAAGPQTVPAPAAELTQAVNEHLARAGIEAHVQQGEPLAGGGLSDVLVIRSRHPLPLPENPEGILTMRIGGTSASILAVVGERPEAPPADAAVLPPAAGGPLPEGGPSAPPDPGPPAAGGPPAPPAGPPAHPAPAAFGSLPPAAPDQLPPVPVGEVATAPPGTGSAAVAATGPVPRDLSGPMTFLYAALAVGTAAGLAGSTLWRSKGVATPWTS